MIVLLAFKCLRCLRPWADTPEAARKWPGCPFCGAEHRGGMM